MQANKRKDLHTLFLILMFSGLAFLSIGSTGCAPSSSQSGDSRNQSGSALNDLPEITEETIRERINDAAIWDVPEVNAAAEPISWRFDEDEPKEITIVEKKTEGTRATIILNIKTGSSPKMRNPRSLEGQIHTEWELKTGWALRRWEITRTENISVKYKNLFNPSAQNSNSSTGLTENY